MGQARAEYLQLTNGIETPLSTDSQIPSSAIYSIDGRRISTTPPYGVYIENGQKKVAVKR